MFKLFKKTIEKLSITMIPSWKVFVIESVISKGDIADVVYDTMARTATIRFNKVQDYQLTDDDIRTTATHEILHIVLADLCEMAEKIDKTHTYSREHAVIRLLEKFVNIDKGVK